MGVRGWTHGYDFYAPIRSVVFHEYTVFSKRNRRWHDPWHDPTLRNRRWHDPWHGPILRYRRWHDPWHGPILRNRRVARPVA